MNKDDILKKSREENQNGDEREDKIKLRSYATSAIIGGFICSILGIIEILVFDRSTTVILIIFSGMMFSKYVLDAFALKKKLDCISSAAWGLCCIMHIVVYILENIR